MQPLSTNHFCHCHQPKMSIIPASLIPIPADEIIRAQVLSTAAFCLESPNRRCSENLCARFSGKSQIDKHLHQKSTHMSASRRRLVRRDVSKITSTAACKAVFAETAAHKFLRPPRTARPHRIFQPLRRSRPAGSIGLCAGSYCRWPGSSRSGRMTAGMATGWRIANPPQRISSATAVGLRLLQENDGHALRGAPPKALLARIRQLRHQQKRSPSNLSRLQICRIGLPGSPPQSEML